MKLAVLAILTSAAYANNDQALGPNLLGLIRDRANQSSTKSWEVGTWAETLIELDFPSMSVFSSSYLTPTPPSVQTLEPAISIGRQAVNSRSNQQLMPDGSAGDPASIGVAVLLGNRTNAPGANWAPAATDQLNALFNNTPRSIDGAISHRTEYVQLWNDFVYMVPPFLALYGVFTSNTSIIYESYNQISLYRKYLRDPSTSLWRHITTAPPAPNSPSPSGTPDMAPFNDTGIWATGNGWALGGMLRVLATIQNSPFSKQFEDEQGDLQDWISELHSAMASRLPNSGIFTNYLDDTTTFNDAASTAMFAATVYRFVTLSSPSKYGNIISAAERARNALYANNGGVHFDANGWLQPVVDPMSFHEQGKQSPEGQCFVLQMNNNWKAWVNSGSKSAAVRAVDVRVIGSLVGASILTMLPILLECI
ncbi:hypothetical protein FRB99_006846 [Tulasnella sp. 403]|nr:hypothetical protein FRB99_006846 [Tulasnella sp. 403]